MTPLDWVWLAVGTLMVGLALTDVFHTLLYPSGVGPVCRPIMRVVWKLISAVKGPSAISGPLGMVAIIATWTCLVAVGWALIYLPFIPDGFLYQTGLKPQTEPYFFEALYLSMVTVATLGFGDIVPVYPGLRLIAPLQALTGFALLTGAVSWILQVYPALTRRRLLALEMTLARQSGGDAGVISLSPSTSTELLMSLARGVSVARVDLSQYDETYYFREPDRESSLPAQLGFAHRLAQSSKNTDDDDVQFAGEMLDKALEDFADLLRNSYRAGNGSRADVFKAYAKDHGQQQY